MGQVQAHDAVMWLQQCSVHLRWRMQLRWHFLQGCYKSRQHAQDVLDKPMELPFTQFAKCSHALARSDQEERDLVHAAAVRRGSTWKFAGDPERDWTLTPHFSGSKLNASNALFCTQAPPCQHLATLYSPLPEH